MVLRADYLIEKLDKKESKNFKEKVVDSLNNIIENEYDFNAVADEIRGYNKKKE
jgi:hypothetical protein